MVHVAGGLDAYRRLIRVHTSLDLDAEALHQVGLDEIARIDTQITELAGRTIGTASLADALAAAPVGPGAVLRRRARRSSTRRRPAWPAPTRRSPTGSAGCPRPRATSCAWARTRRSTRRSRTTASRRSTARGPASTSSTRRTRHASTLRGRGARLPRGRARATTCRSRSGRSCRTCRSSARHLGPTAFFEGWGLYTERLSDEMGLYGGDLDRIGALSFDAWRASRLVVDTGMHALGWTRERAIRVHARPHGARAQQHRQRGRPLHRDAGPGPGLQDGPAGAAPAARRGPGDPRRPVRHPWLPRRRPRATAPSPCRRSAASSRPGPARCSTRPDAGRAGRAGDAGRPADPGGTGTHRTRRPARPRRPVARERPAQPRHPLPRGVLDARRRRGLGAPRGGPARRLRRGRRRACRPRLAHPDDPGHGREPAGRHEPPAAARARARRRQPRPGGGRHRRRRGQPRGRHAPRVRGGRRGLGRRGAGPADRPDAPPGRRLEPVGARQREHRGRARREPRHVRGAARRGPDRRRVRPGAGGARIGRHVPGRGGRRARRPRPRCLAAGPPRAAALDPHRRPASASSSRGGLRA